MAIRDLKTALQHRYLHTLLQPVGGKQFAAIQALEIIFCPDIPHKTTQAPIHPTVEPPEIAPPLQQIQKSTSVDLSPPLQEQPGSNLDGHRYPTRYSLSKNHTQWLAPENTPMQLNNWRKPQITPYISKNIWLVQSLTQILGSPWNTTTSSKAQTNISG